MSGATITRADLAEAVYQEVGLSRNESAQLVESVLDEVPILPRKVLIFRASNVLKERINRGNRQSIA